MNAAHSRPVHPAQAASRAPLHIDLARAPATEPGHFIVGLATQDVVEMTARIVGWWLCQRFERKLVFIRKPNGESNLAVEALYDTLYQRFSGQAAMVAAVRFPADPGAGDSAACARSFELMSKSGAISLRCHGLARAYLNWPGGKVQVTFDGLPGAIEFSIAKHKVGGAPRRETIAWYGLGICNASAAEIAATLKPLATARRRRRAKMRSGVAARGRRIGTLNRRA